MIREIALYRMIQREIAFLNNKYHPHNLCGTLTTFLILAGIPTSVLIYWGSPQTYSQAMGGLFGVAVMVYYLFVLFLGTTVGDWWKAKKLSEYDHRNMDIIRGMIDNYGVTYDSGKCYYTNLIRYRDYMESL